MRFIRRIPMFSPARLCVCAEICFKERHADRCGRLLRVMHDPQCEGWCLAHAERRIRGCELVAGAPCSFDSIPSSLLLDTDRQVRETSLPPFRCLTHLSPPCLLISTADCPIPHLSIVCFCLLCRSASSASSIRLLMEQL